MSAALFRLLDAVGRRRALAGWLTAVLAALVVAGGVAAGAGQQSAAALPRPVAGEATGAATPAAAAAVAPSLQGIVVEVRPRALAILTKRGRLVVAPTDAATRYRKGGRSVPRAAIQRGQSVIVLGRRDGQGRLRAVGVIVRGTVALPATGAAPLSPPTT